MKKKITIALMYDFDKTLCTQDMQEYTFIPSIGMENGDFWDEVGKLKSDHCMDPILAYMYSMLRKSRDARKSIRREDFVKDGKNLQLYPGVKTWFKRINEYSKSLGAEVEHYIISSGLKEIIEGSEICKEFKEIYACEFLYDENGVACWPKNVVNYTTKTQFLFRINKGILDISDDVSLNEYTPEDEREIPFRNMIYIGDGLTDVPCMKLVKVNGGYSIAVYKDGQQSKVEPLLLNGRVDFIEKADYSSGRSLEKTVKKIINKAVSEDELIRYGSKQIKDCHPDE